MEPPDFEARTHAHPSNLRQKVNKNLMNKTNFYRVELYCVKVRDRYGMGKEGSLRG